MNIDEAVPSGAFSDDILEIPSRSRKQPMGLIAPTTIKGPSPRRLNQIKQNHYIKQNSGTNLNQIISHSLSNLKSQLDSSGRQRGVDIKIQDGVEKHGASPNASGPRK